MNPNDTQVPPQTPAAAGGETPSVPPLGGMPGEGEPHRGIGPIVGTIIIVAILIAGAFYFWNMYLKTPATEPTVPGETRGIVEDRMVADLRKVGTSDDVSSIEQDLQSSDLDNLDDDLSAIEASI